ncbi:MAG: asparagine synthase (glutamine-hydrolyzing) [Deltaproteobacteria bacterium]|nr:asparagine synthase (glutamine-hydrolyzing) [Deltaproteobacteria bacterium]
MCGICGVIDFDGRQGKELSAVIRDMIGRLKHRGPDADGYWLDRGIALGHARLSIIDLAGSVQPMLDGLERYVITFNGEIYNYVELRRDLEDQGVTFKTNGDTEVLLAAYIAHGPECLQRLNGMFAFAVWDRKEQVLFAARDRMGVKPFYYGQGEGGLFAFASELQALKGLPLDFSINTLSLRQYLRHGFIWSPETIFQGVKELRPAHYLLWNRQGFALHQYWTLPATRPDWLKKPEQEVAAELRDLIGSSVNLRLRSDVPVGAFLSGGLDSSIVVSAMSARSKTDIHTFSIGFAQGTFDESPFAREVAEYLRTEHHEGHEDLRPEELIFDLVKHYGQPYGDSSAIPTWYLCRETRKHVVVALSGDGADELFCGYRRYYARRLLAYYQRIPLLLRDKVWTLLEKLPEGTGYYDSSIIKKLRLFAALEQRVRKDPADIYPAYFTADDLPGILNEKTGQQPGGIGQLTLPNDAEGVVEMMMHSDLLHYLPDDILAKVDRASMAHGLEVRSPFMDYRLVEFACRLPLAFKLQGSTSKYILRKAFAGSLPPRSLSRAKHGFAVPVGDWFQGTLRELFRDQVLSGNTDQFVNRNLAERLLAEHQSGKTDHGHRLWLLLFLHVWQQWWREQ